MKVKSKLGLGGGCHWCTEAVFQAVTGVENVKQGYIKSVAPQDHRSEAIIIEFSDLKLLERIIDIHLQTHASTKQHSRRKEYRSAIYYFDEEMKSKVEVVMNTLSRKRNQKYITQLLPFVSFEKSWENIRNYYKTRPNAPFCKRYIEPKLTIVKRMSW
ncbi:MAG: peptide-methionine (S)-S-oxide reductase [Nonlabens sp.]|uniref:peptide-methionine (S)-S-oxide reductase n=1 Tax=Nonlabens sp. TaxID=1888209 RepID=UPI00321B83D6